MIRGISPSLVKIVAGDGGTGSGFIINSEGDVVTNSHVVGSSPTVAVHLQDGRSFNGTVLGRDEYLDLALIQLQGGRGGFRAATLGNSSRVSAGQDVLALGYHLGSDLGDSPTVTRGIVSAMRTDATGAVWIQTDAPINPGSSGGPLLDRSGRVVGVVTSRQDYDWQSGRNVEGVGFALAVNELKDRMDFLATGGKALLPTPTPVPTPTSSGTGDWITWDEVRSWGHERDVISEPRIILQGNGPFPSLYYSYLHVECYSYGLELYLSEDTIDDFYLPAVVDNYPVTYSVDGRDGPTVRWQYEAYDDIERETWYVPDSVKDAIVDALLGDPTMFMITVSPGTDNAWDYIFFPQGFREAMKPVLRQCPR